MTDIPTYTINRQFDAPVPLVWKAFSDPVLLSRWYGPGVDTIIHEFDLRQGGVWRNEMRWGENSDLSMMTFQNITPEQSITWHHCSVDENWQVAPSKMMPDWPQTFLTTVTFTSLGDQTKVTLSQTPMDATEAEIACFAKMMGGMDKGWGSGFKIIEDILAELQS